MLAKGDGWIFVALLLGVVSIGEALKAFRTPALLLIVLVAAIYARETMLRRQNLPLLLFSAWTFACVILSYLDAFPNAWTRYHDRGVIFQQASFLAVLLPLVSASQKWWDDPRFDLNREAIMVAVVVCAFVVGAAFDIVFGIEGVAIGRHGAGDRPFVTMRSYLLLALLALSYLAFRSREWRGLAILILLLLLCLSVLRPLFLQNTIVYLILGGFLTASILRLPVDRLMLGAFIVLVAAATIYGLLNPLRIFSIDPNTGWRLAWWNDALEAIVQTGGIGVGFGTELLRNEYSALLERDSYREEGGTFLLISTHSAFFDTMLRTGLVGVVLFGIVIARCFPPSCMALPARAHCCAMFAALILCLHSNLGLQSPMYSIGVAICIGYLQSERRKAYAGASAAKGLPAHISPQDTALAEPFRSRY